MVCVYLIAPIIKSTDSSSVIWYQKKPVVLQQLTEECRRRQLEPLWKEKNP